MRPGEEGQLSISETSSVQTGLPEPVGVGVVILAAGSGGVAVRGKCKT